METEGASCHNFVPAREQNKETKSNIMFVSDYMECFDDTCSQLLNLTIKFMPPISYITNQNYY